MDAAQDIAAVSPAAKSGAYLIMDKHLFKNAPFTHMHFCFLGATERDNESNDKGNASICDAPALTTTDPSLKESWNKNWATVKSTPTDFDSWEELLRMIDGQDGGYGPEAPASNVVTMRTVYDAFLGQFPLCFGYWKKYSDLEFMSSGAQGAVEIFERGVKSISSSVDLWVHYCSFIMEHKRDDHGAIEQILERGAATVGMDFMPHVFWDKYLEYYEQKGDHVRLFTVMGRIITIPMHQYARFYQQYTHLLGSRPLKDLLSTEDYSKHEEQLKERSADGQEHPQMSKEQLEQEMRQLLLNSSALIYAKTAEETNKRWPFEAEIKRPYFHVKPIDPAQLLNWRRYLDFEETEGNVERIRLLYERCLVSCALYEEFWLRYAAWTRSQGRLEDLNGIYIRATLMVPPTNPSVRFALAMLQEERGETDLARQQYQAILQSLPGHIEAIVRFANFERRSNPQGVAAAEVVYASQIGLDTIDELAQTTIVTMYAKFLWQCKKDVDAARAIFKTGEGKFHSRFYFSNYLKFEMDQPGEDYEARVCDVFEQIRLSGLPENIKNDYNQNYLDFLMEFGSSAAKYNELEAQLRPVPVVVGESSRKRAAAVEPNEYPEKIHRPEEAVAGLEVPTGASAVAITPDSQHWPYSQHSQTSYGYAPSGGHPYAAPNGTQWS
ncbi:pre-mRNA-processing factor 39 [Entomortierella parvispora]|uniref:Pre-mRNA-processing factor 39 n=1 Tax=Entomortierella parvispora TaxID=205924 RepID=A0A9P3LZ86_9FUNG|nr:pre-mRNA-processing factor 39 [Entomortierella parvispora]